MTSKTVDIDRLRAMAEASAPAATVVVERGPVTFLAEAVLEQSPVFRDAAAARQAGFAQIPAPPTFAFVMANWGRFAELQQADGADEALRRVVGALKASGGLILHGEQEFAYHRPVVAGDVLVGSARIRDIYQKHSKGSTMTFVVQETTWRVKATGELAVTSVTNLIHRA